MAGGLPLVKYSLGLEGFRHNTLFSGFNILMSLQAWLLTGPGISECVVSVSTFRRMFIRKLLFQVLRETSH
jgi:hypothetical protein